MEYRSTRSDNVTAGSTAAIIKGIAADGGLFVPQEMPKVDLAFIEGLQHLSYDERAKKVLGLFLTDYTQDELEGCVHRAYASGKFDTEKRAPLQIFDDFSVLELFHGPTSAFKDMALQLLPQLMGTALKKTGEKKEVLILVATSGDTGKAALEGFADVPQISIMVFYPEGGVSPIQRLQMVTQKGSNVNVTAVRGNFDDAQSGVKKIFGDKAFNAQLEREGVRLSSANSINWGRLVPQIVYYFSAYADLLSAGKIQPEDKVNFTVPTGNFGNILAGFYAKCMGLPVGKLVCASNANNVLTDFLRTGIYNRKREFFKTITPSMDILISSNLERLLYHVTRDADKVSGWMKELAENGRYDVGSDVLKKMQETFWADFTKDEGTKVCIDEVFKEKHYLLDTHTSVAWSVAEKYRKKTGDVRPMVIVSTASPYKFSGSVLAALGDETAPTEPFALLSELEKKTGTKAPIGLSSLKAKNVLHQDAVDRETMEDAVMKFAKSMK